MAIVLELATVYLEYKDQSTSNLHMEYNMVSEVQILFLFI